MDEATIARLNRINRDFYRATTAEFDETRQGAWLGWGRLLDFIDSPIASVLDLGCGNGRFARFLARRQPQPFQYIGVDNNPELLEIARHSLTKAGIEATLLESDLVLGELSRRSAQLVALFGLVHHVPGVARRRALLADAGKRVLPGGHLAFACWRFYEQARFRRRVIAWPQDIAVEKHDYLLDWRRGERALRYCHYVDDAEHDGLIEATGLSVVADYRADGAEGTLNRYTVLKKG